MQEIIPPSLLPHTLLPHITHPVPQRLTKASTPSVGKAPLASTMTSTKSCMLAVVIAAAMQGQVRVVVCFPVTAVLSSCLPCPAFGSCTVASIHELWYPMAGAATALSHQCRAAIFAHDRPISPRVCGACPWWMHRSGIWIVNVTAVLESRTGRLLVHDDGPFLPVRWCAWR